MPHHNVSTHPVFTGENLYNAIQTRDVDAIHDILDRSRELILQPYNFESFGKDEQYPLYHAYSTAYDIVSDDPLEIVTLLLPYSDIFEVNNQSQNLLHVAVFTGEYEIAKYAMNNSVSATNTDVNGKTPVQYIDQDTPDDIRVLFRINDEDYS
tara:strand:+ start:679 stop:1137 length:459 start_codon:yes stop_codon:yes gene_type:complete